MPIWHTDPPRSNGLDPPRARDCKSQNLESEDEKEEEKNNAADLLLSQDQGAIVDKDIAAAAAAGGNDAANQRQEKIAAGKRYKDKFNQYAQGDD